MKQLAPIASALDLPTIISRADDAARLRFLEFFAVTIRNAHTRRAYAHGVAEFLDWCEARDVVELAAVQPIHVAAYIEELTRARAAPTAKQRLAGIRHLFDWLVTGQIVPTNPAASVRGPSHSVNRLRK